MVLDGSSYDDSDYIYVKDMTSIVFPPSTHRISYNPFELKLR